MTATELLASLDQLGVQLEAQGDRLRFRPQSLVPPAMIADIRHHKIALLDLVSDRGVEREAITWEATAPAEEVQAALDVATREWDQLIALAQLVRQLPYDPDHEDHEERGPDGWPIDSFDPPAPCRMCNTLELWQTVGGDWRCMRCEPPDVSLRWLRLAEEYRERY